MSQKDFDKDYYECGIVTGKSLYSCYRWIPELTIPMAMVLIDYLKIKPGARILDYGCAKGFLVKALRWLQRDAWGYDFSEYAIGNVDIEVLAFCTTENYIMTRSFDFCIAKDVFEHIPEMDLAVLLNVLDADTLFAVIPLGDGDKYIVPANDRDATHIHRQPASWWENLFNRYGWSVLNIAYQISGIKDQYYRDYPEGHGFFRCKRA
jgi:SAM-dependent methyltransferase